MLLYSQGILDMKLRHMREDIAAIEAHKNITYIINIV
jgi:hypothetical protein